MSKTASASLHCQRFGIFLLFLVEGIQALQTVSSLALLGQNDALIQSKSLGVNRGDEPFGLQRWQQTAWMQPPTLSGKTYGCFKAARLRPYAPQKRQVKVLRCRMDLQLIDPQLAEDIAFLGQSFLGWVADEVADPGRAAQQFVQMEQRRVLSIETLLLSPLYFLLLNDPRAQETTQVTRSWTVMLVMSVVFGSIGSTFGFYFFDIFMARCIAFDATKKPSLAVTHSILACVLLGAPYGWVSNKLTGLVQSNNAEDAA